MDPYTEFAWHMWRSKPEGDPLAEYWRGRWEQRVKERASSPGSDACDGDKHTATPHPEA